MSKVCFNCGEIIEDDSSFCTKCGTRQDATAAAPENKPNAFAEAVDNMKPAVNEALEKGKAMAGEIAEKVKSVKVDDLVAKAKAEPVKYLVPALAAVAVVLVVLIVLLAGKPYTGALNTMMDVVGKGKVEKIEKMAPAEYWDYFEDMYDTDVEDMIDEMSDAWEEAIEDMEDEYGDNIKVKYKVVKEKKLSDRKLSKLADALDDQYDIDGDTVKAAYDLEVEMTIKGSEDDDTNETDLSVVKIGGKWYLISYYTSGDGYRVIFLMNDLL